MDGRFPKLLFSLPSGMDLRYSVSPPVGDADTGDLTLLSHIYCLLFFNDRIVGKLIPGDSTALFHKTDDSLCVGICLRNLIQGLLHKFFPVHDHHSFCVVFATAQRICGLYKLENFVI